jgi:hypothetical protein
MASLYGERLIVTPLETLQAANRFLELEIPDSYPEEIVNNDSISADAKNAGQRFSVEKRNEAYQKLESFYGEELNKGLNWMVQNNPGTRLVPDLPGSLAS